MSRNVFTYKTLAWLMAALMMVTGETSMASSLKLPDPSELAGHWQATLSAGNDAPEAQKLQDKPSNTCAVELALNQTVGKGADCLAAWLEETPIGWFPEPDGISITGKDGSRILFFSRQRDEHYLATLKSGLVITFER
ncbi:AprI/Inh family metalloprotease inhibitor [Pseudomonas sp. TH06]|uniref:AprI/Inh family metalloprotease inhibitor n=1 Tax=Pseudomonas sp. TH06 TaxID=2796372 RepID=UPI001912608D|nr:AprI/Inh family metalloprotease inhibitor [Pseudomonas sp. TH06]MBK5529333.1 AprI/Inh family metalloprotease inhibitor [Pseudomonas sp. TH06]